MLRLPTAHAGSIMQFYCTKSLGALRPKKFFHSLPFVALGLICLSLGFYLPTRTAPSEPSQNMLSTTGTEPVRIGRTLPQSFENLDAESILGLRRQMVAQHSMLIAAPYNPRTEIFSDLSIKRPWFGTEGYYYYGIGPDSTRGKAVASRDILNPFMLLSAEFFGLSIWNDGNLYWDFERAPPEKAAAEGFPLYPEAAGIVWDSAQSQAVLLYKVSAFLEASAPYLVHPLKVTDIRFALNTINARDWGFDYFSVSSEGLSGIESTQELDSVVRSDQRFAPTTLCGLNRECIHSTPPMPELSSLVAKSLPARVRIKMWREHPANAGEKADFEFTIGLM